MLKDLQGKNCIEDYENIINQKNSLINAVINTEKVHGKREGEFFGIPFLIKDNLQLKGTETTCCSSILKGYKSVYTATAVQKLLDAGFSVVGKTNMDEFAMGSSNEHSVYGPVKNPVDVERVPGGSSGGSAAAVASGMIPFALGSDTGGSVRQPASFCGVVGYKPSYGVISRYGLTAFSSSLDQIGVLANSVEDVAIITNIMKGKDLKDSTSIDYKCDLLSLIDKNYEGLKIAVPKIVFDDGTDKRIKDEFKKIIDNLRKNNTVDIIDFDELKYSVSVYYIIAPAEASANLSRFDGVRYGNRLTGNNLDDLYNKTRNEGFGIEVKRRILMGAYTLSSTYYDAYFSKASKVRNLISEKLNDIYNDYDILLTPTSPSLPPKIGEKLSPLSYYLMDLFTIPANLAGLPSVSIPVSKIDGLPFGILLTGKRLDDAKLMGIANTFERNLGVQE